MTAEPVVGWGNIPEDPAISKWEYFNGWSEDAMFLSKPDTYNEKGTLFNEVIKSFHIKYSPRFLYWLLFCITYMVHKSCWELMTSWSSCGRCIVALNDINKFFGSIKDHFIILTSNVGNWNTCDLINIVISYHSH